MISADKLQGVLRLIYGMDHNQLNQVIRSVKGTRKNIDFSIAISFNPGDKVKINHRKALGFGICEVVKVLTKNVVVKTKEGRQLKASPSLLEKV